MKHFYPDGRKMQCIQCPFIPIKLLISLRIDANVLNVGKRVSEEFERVGEISGAKSVTGIGPLQFKP